MLISVPLLPELCTTSWQWRYHQWILSYKWESQTIGHVYINSRDLVTSRHISSYRMSFMELNNRMVHIFLGHCTWCFLNFNAERLNLNTYKKNATKCNLFTTESSFDKIKLCKFISNMPFRYSWMSKWSFNLSCWRRLWQIKKSKTPWNTAFSPGLLESQNKVGGRGILTVAELSNYGFSQKSVRKNIIFSKV